MKKPADIDDNLINNDFIDLDDLTAQAENIDVVIRNVDYDFFPSNNIPYFLLIQSCVIQREMA